MCEECGFFLFFPMIDILYILVDKKGLLDVRGQWRMGRLVRDDREAKKPTFFLPTVVGYVCFLYVATYNMKVSPPFTV